MNSPFWRKLHAVRSGCAYTADSHWNFDDPITKDRLLSILPQLLGKSS